MTPSEIATDGAHEGLRPSQGFDALNGGEPVEGEAKDRVEMEAWIHAAPSPADLAAAGDQPLSDAGYDDTARSAARVFLEYLEEHPDARALPLTQESVFDFALPPEEAIRAAVPVGPPGLYDAVKAARPDAYEHIFSELSGFQAGWAYNAARSVLGLPPAPNPAIMEVET